jgi:hypothetical protein
MLAIGWRFDVFGSHTGHAKGQEETQHHPVFFHAVTSILGS